MRSTKERRRSPNLTEKLAATLLMLTDGNGKPIVDPEDAKHLTAAEIAAKFDYDHGVHHAIGGSMKPSNLTPRLRAEHRQKTAKIDIPQIAKTKRLARANDASVNALLRKAGQSGDEPTSSPQKKKSRALPGSKASGLKKKMNGDVVRR